MHAGSRPLEGGSGWVVRGGLPTRQGTWKRARFSYPMRPAQLRTVRGKSKKSDTHTVNPKCNMLITPTLRPSFPQRGAQPAGDTLGGHYAVAGRGSVGCFLSGR